MHDRIIEALLAKGWGYPLIALRANIAESRLRDGNMGRRECDRLERVAETEAHICIDSLYAESEE